MKLVQVDAPVVLTYRRVEVEEPSDLRYIEPWAAVRVGAPEPQNIPKFEVVPNFTPEVVAPPAGVAVPVLTLTVPAVATAPVKVEVPVTAKFPVAVTPASLSSTPSTVTPLADVYSLTVSTVNVGLDMVALVIVGLVRVLLVSVWLAVSVTSVSDTFGMVKVLVVAVVMPES